MPRKQRGLPPRKIVQGGIPVGIDPGFTRLVRDVPGEGAPLPAPSGDWNPAPNHKVLSHGRFDAQGTGAHQLNGLTARATILDIFDRDPVDVRNHPCAKRVLLRAIIVGRASLGRRKGIPRAPDTCQLGHGRFFPDRSNGCGDRLIDSSVLLQFPDGEHQRQACVGLRHPLGLPGPRRPNHDRGQAQETYRNKREQNEDREGGHQGKAPTRRPVETRSLVFAGGDVCGSSH